VGWHNAQQPCDSFSPMLSSAGAQALRKLSWSATPFVPAQNLYAEQAPTTGGTPCAFS